MLVKSPSFAPSDALCKLSRAARAALTSKAPEEEGTESARKPHPLLGPSFQPGEPVAPNSLPAHACAPGPQPGQVSPPEPDPIQTVQLLGLGGGVEEAHGGEGESRSEEGSSHRSRRPEADADPALNEALGAESTPSAAAKA